MEPQFHPNNDPLARGYPSLPVLTPDPPKRSEREKYGSLFYLGIIGLFVLAILVGWFGWQTWSMRQVWANVYILHDAHRSDADRVQAAYSLSHDPRMHSTQRWDIAMRRPLPPLARYVIAEGIGPDAVAADPRGFTAAVARSEGWPAWLRAVLTRTLAYAAAEGVSLPRDSLSELSRNDDPATALWADFALALSQDTDRAAVSRLRDLAASDDANRELAHDLISALDAGPGPVRLESLNSATLWLRHHHPEAAPLWNGWKVDAGRVIPK
jgi:hypothetical protein